MLGAYSAGGVIALMSALYMGHESYYYAGMSLTLVAIGVLVPVGPVPWRHRRRPLRHFVAFLLLDPTPLAEWNWSVFIANSIFLIVTAAVVVIGAFINRRLRRRAFDAAWEQERASEELRLVNERVKQSYLEISEKNREIEDAYRSKSQFLDNISHELRTPLTCILTPLEGLLAGNARGELRGVFEDMHTASRQLYDLINDLLDYSKYGARDQPLQRDPVDLRASSTSTSAPGSRPPASGCSPSSGSRPRAPSSPAAAPRARQGRPQPPVQRRQVHPVRRPRPRPPRRRRRLAELRVEDTGIGMSPEVQAKLFTPFYQGDATSTRAFEGTGIGLALVKTIVKRHDGDIRRRERARQGHHDDVALPRSPLDPTELMGMEPGPHARPRASASIVAPIPQFSEPSQKILVTDDLLAAEAPRRRHRRQTAASAPTFAFPDAAPLLGEHLPRARIQRSKILVCDDHPEILRLISRLLAPFHDISTANNGEEGLKKIDDEHPDLVISDVMMPKMSGFQLVEQLRENPATERLPVLLLTARADGHDRVRGLKRGASDYLVKPFLPEELKARVDNLLRSPALRELPDPPQRGPRGQQEHPRGPRPRPVRRHRPHPRRRHRRQGHLHRRPLRARQLLRRPHRRAA
jgi:signal transduction histidine kinase/CheY-like chemotaxis protein